MRTVNLEAVKKYRSLQENDLAYLVIISNVHRFSYNIEKMYDFQKREPNTKYIKEIAGELSTTETILLSAALNLYGYNFNRKAKLKVYSLDESFEKLDEFNTKLLYTALQIKYPIR